MLADAVGCTGPLAGGETCRHTASVTLAPGGGSAFVLGPRGLAAAPLPAIVDVRPTGSGPAAGLRRQGRPERTPAVVKRIIGVVGATP